MITIYIFWSLSIFDKEYIAQTGLGKIHYLITLLFHAWM